MLLNACGPTVEFSGQCIQQMMHKDFEEVIFAMIFELSVCAESCHVEYLFHTSHK